MSYGFGWFSFFFFTQFSDVFNPLYFCRDKDFIARNLHIAPHPWSARAHHHALHSCHGVAVSSTQHTPWQLSYLKAAY